MQVGAIIYGKVSSKNFPFFNLLREKKTEKANDENDYSKL